MKWMTGNLLEENYREISQPGDVYWKTTDGIPHPHVIIETTAEGTGYLTCVISTNLKRINLPGNILLDQGEANLPKASIVLVSRTVTIQQRELGAYIGTLTPDRMQQIQSGIQFVARLSRASSS
jgi:mRNA interferase MazF